MVVKRYRHLGDFASAGVPILSMYNPDLLYVTANLQETRLRGVAPGNPVELHLNAFAEPFHGRVVWINKSTGAQFALMPRNVVSGEFTRVVQRVPVRIAIEKDDRWPLLRAGLSVRVVIAHGDGDPHGRSRPPARWRSSRRVTTGRRSDRMSGVNHAASAGIAAAAHPRPRRQSSPWLAAVAIVPILATVYQTLVLTDVTDDVIRKGIDGEHYSMIWTNVCWGVAILYGVFAGIWAMARFGGRDTLLVGLVWFALGNLLCGAATDVPTLAAAKLVEGIGKGMVIVICRSLLYRQFDRMVIVAIGFYGVIAYATRPTTPLLTALVNDALSWRWIFWVNVPLALLALPLVLRFIKPDRPPRPLPLRIDWISVTLFAAWIVSLTFTFGWYRKWGGWTLERLHGDGPARPAVAGRPGRPGSALA